jgi:alpha-amylase/alpha-mannosidase (GH57 family)
MVATPAKKTARQTREEQQLGDSIQQAQGVYITIHGHYYQPPRENPYLNAIEKQPSAQPYHNWNERIHHECYRPNAFARIVNDRQQVVGIVNNFEYLSFNIGPTLMSWLKKYDLEVYQRILEGDRLSQERLNGHGNAIAQVYNHIILPLANQRDKYTQIRWGKADFRAHFGRNPEGMWLAETAVDYPTVEALIDEEIRFIILAPTQAQRCRPIPTEENPEPQWDEVGESQIDPTRPYRCFIEDGRYLDIFFYDGPISGDMGFSDALNTADNLAGRLSNAVRGDRDTAQLISVATDGETFGHHKKATEKCLAYAFTKVFADRNWTVTNYAHYLSINPPTWEVFLKPATAWSCAHGVERWHNDCGCGGGGLWTQKWRKPLRDSLDWLRDRLATVYDEVGSKLFKDPWLARDEYIQVVGTVNDETWQERSLKESTVSRKRLLIQQFLEQHQTHPLTSEEQIDALRLLEMQRHCLLMYTSCGWFFDEISRPEGVQILRYASRAIELAAEIGGIHYQTEFINRLSKAPSNVPHFSNGAKIYRDLVIPSQVSLEQVAAHYAISSLFNHYTSTEAIYCYTIEQLDYQKQHIGTMSLAVGQIELTSEITWEHQRFTFATLHLGGWDFHCCIKPFLSRLKYTEIKKELFGVFKQANTAQNILAMNRVLGDRCFSLQDLFPEERHHVMSKITESTEKRLNQLYNQVYRENYSIILAFQREKIAIPQELQVAAQVALSHRVREVISWLEKPVTSFEDIDRHLRELKAIATEANHLHCQLNIAEAKPVLEKLLLRLLWQMLYDGDPKTIKADIQRLQQAIDMGKQLHLGLSLDRAQEIYFQCLQQIAPDRPISTNNCRWNASQIKSLLKLGSDLGVDVSY